MWTGERHSRIIYWLNDANSEPGRSWDRKQGVDIRENNSKCERMWTEQTFKNNLLSEQFRTRQIMGQETGCGD